MVGVNQNLLRLWYTERFLQRTMCVGFFGHEICVTTKQYLFLDMSDDKSFCVAHSRSIFDMLTHGHFDCR